MLLLGYLRDRIVRPLVVFVAIGVMLAGTVGIPCAVPIPAGKEQSQPYPCMNHPCGCVSAEACWRDCCCLTASQKLAWAEAHGVIPPAHVLAAAAGEKLAPCCSAQSPVDETTRQDRSHDSLARGCHSVAKSALHPDEAREGGDSQLVLVLSNASRKCQGQAQIWLLLSTAMMTAPVSFSVDVECAGEAATFAPPLASRSLRPAVPPPKA
jgi:hypothetical protein